MIGPDGPDGCRQEGQHGRPGPQTEHRRQQHHQHAAAVEMETQPVVEQAGQPERQGIGGRGRQNCASNPSRGSSTRFSRMLSRSPQANAALASRAFSAQSR